MREAALLRRHGSPRPTAFDPVAAPEAATQRAATSCCENMHEQGYITRAEYDDGHRSRPLPTAADDPAAARDAAAPYFTTLAAPAARRPLAAAGQRAVRAAACKIRTTLDLELQQAAEQAITAVAADRRRPPQRLAGGDRQQDRRGPRDGRRPIERHELRRSPFNLATRATASPARRSSRSRSPTALEHGLRPELDRGLARSRLHRARQRRQGAVHRPQLRQHLLRGTTTLANATTISDNSVYAAASGIARSGPRGSRGWPARWASARRSRTTRDDPRRPQGRRHRRSTWRTRTRRSPTAGTARLSGTLGAPDDGPGRDRRDQCADRTAQGRPATSPTTKRILSPRRSRADRRSRSCRRVVASGTGSARPDRRASPPARPARPRTTATPGSSAGRRSHGRRLGRLPGRAQADGDRVPRRAGRRRHLSRR